MTKPVIVTRAGKGLALSYTELDTNFTNLRDSTINFTGDAGDTRSMDLNDSTQITGTHNIKVTVDEATQKIVIDNTLSDYTQEPMGFVNRTDSTISFNNGTRQFTIAPVGANYVVFCTGEQYTKTTSSTVTIPNTTGLYYIYFDDTGTLQYKTSFFTLSSETPVAYVYWNATNSTGILADERHGIVLDWRTHEYLHRTRGAAFANGLVASNYTTVGTGTSNTHAQLDIGNGTFFDEDIDINITHSNTPTANTFEQDLQGPARIPVAYHSGSTGTWVLDSARDYPLKNGTSLMTYNLNTGGNWTTPDASNTFYVAMWVVATNFLNTPVIAIMGQNQYNKLDDAQLNNTWANLDLTYFPAQELRPLYRLIFRTASSYTNTPKSYLADITDLRYQAIGTIGVSSGAVLSVTGTAGRISSTGGVNPVLDLITTGVSAGSYTTTNITVDAYGRITAISNGTSAQNAFQTVSIGGVTNLVADSTTDTLTISSSGTLSITGDTATDTVTFDIAQLSPNPAGTYGSATQIPVVTVNNRGQVTGVTTATNVIDITNTYSVTAVTTSIDLRNGTNTSLLSTLRKTMVFKCAPGNGSNTQFYLPNYQNMNGQYGEFTFIFVPNIDAANFSTKYLFQVVINQQTDNLVSTIFTTGLSNAVGQPSSPPSNPDTINGTTTISGGGVSTATIDPHYGKLSYGTAVFPTPINISVQAPPSGTTAILKPIFNGNIIDRIEVVNPGSGYVTAPTFYINNLTHNLILYPHDMVVLRARFIPDMGIVGVGGVGTARNVWLLEKIMSRSRSY